MKYIFLLLLLTSCQIGNSEKSDASTNDSYNVTDNSTHEENEDSDSIDDSTGENPDCSEQINSTDGTGGFLWKPESDSDGNLVILFPSEYDIKFTSVSAFTLTGDLEEGVFVYFSNGDRQTWRFDMPGSEYTGRLLIDAETQECVWFVENPAERQD